MEQIFYDLVTLRGTLVSYIDEHRTEAFITCPESCICWDLEETLNQVEKTIMLLNYASAAVRSSVSL